MIAVRARLPDRKRAAGQPHAGFDLVDHEVPAVAGDVPVEFVVLLEELQAVGDGETYGEGPGHILSPGNPDFQFPVCTVQPVRAE